MPMFATLRATDEESACLDETLRAVEEAHAERLDPAERRLVAVLEQVPGGLNAFRAYDLARTARETDRGRALYCLGRRMPVDSIRAAIAAGAAAAASAVNVPLLGDVD